MKSFIEYSKEVDKSELQRQKDHHEEMAEKHKEKAEHSLMMGDKDGFALHMAKHDHFKSQGDHLKTMKEETEQIDELRTSTLLRYQTKANKALIGGDRNKEEKRIKGIQTANYKIQNRYKVKEEAERIDELSKDTLTSYALKAGKSLGGKVADIGNAKQISKIYANKTSAKEVKKDAIHKAGKRMFGLGRAASRLAKEEIEQVDEATPAWQRKEGKSASGGLNRKGIASYRKQNPGSKLSMAVTTKPSKLKPGSKAANRRKSFCARMSGMKKRLTSAKTAKDPNSRINKSLRKWNC